jgi:FAD:protein FMN transferase
MPSPKSVPRLKPRTSILEFEAIGTHWKIELSYMVRERLAELKKAIMARIEEFDKSYSRFRADSLVSQIAQKPGIYVFPDDAKPMMELYKTLNMLSNGLVTPLIGDVLVAAGYDAEYSLQTSALKKPKAWDLVIEYDHPNLTMREPATLDFGAAGKGYLADIVGELMKQHGLNDFCINAGGDVVCRGVEDNRIALEHPEHPSLAIGVATINDASLCGSAGNRRVWGEFHHVIDPVSLESPKHIKGLWVMASSGLVADGLATALYFVPPENLAKHFDFEYAIINEDMSLNYSKNFPGEFF